MSVRAILKIFLVGFVYTSLMLLVLNEVCISLQQDSGYTNPCNVNGSPAVVEVNETYFKSIVDKIFADRSSGVTILCQNIYDKATNLKKYIMTYPILLSRVQLRNDNTHLFTCNLASGVDRSQTVECMKSSFEMLWNLSMSVNVIMSTEYNFQKQNIAELLSYLQEVNDSIKHGLCSIASNGLSKLVNLNPINLLIGPLDVVRSLTNNSRQMKVILAAYQLTSVIANVCSTTDIPQVLG